MRIERYDDLPEGALAVRIEVFVEEQGFCDEQDEIDGVATHFVMLDGEQPIATCRIFPEENGNGYLLGRLAVRKNYRGHGLGRELLNAVEAHVRGLGKTRLSLHSQYHAKGFYEACGYVAYGDVEDEQGCPHIWMTKSM